MGGVITDVTVALIKSNVSTLMGTIATIPTLLLTDGKNVTYACDVNIGEYDSTGLINQFKNDVLGIPGTSGFTASDTLLYGTTLHNVPLARNNNALIYADVGTAVIVTKNSAGTWQVTGLAEEQVGTYVMIPVDINQGIIGTIQTVNFVRQILNLGDYVVAGGFGNIPLASIGIYKNGTFEALA